MVRMNGTDCDIAGMTLAQYLSEAGYDADTVAIERNEAIVPKAQYGAVRMEDGDRIEVVSFVGGG